MSLIGLEHVAVVLGAFGTLLGAVFAYSSQKSRHKIDRSTVIIDGYNGLVDQLRQVSVQQQDQIRTQQEQIATLIAELESTKDDLRRVTSELETWKVINAKGTQAP